MADEKPADTAAGGGNKKKKTLLIGGVAAVVLLVLGVVAGVLLGGKDGEESAEEAAAAAAPPVSIYASLGDKFVVVLQDQGKQRYFQVSLTALTRDEAVAKALEVHAPLIRSRLDALFAGQDFATLRTAEGKVALRERSLATIREVLTAETGEPGVEQVFFTEFVLQ